MAWADIVNFVFKEVPTFNKMNQILENIKVHNHKGANQGVRIDGQLAPATVPAPASGTVTLTGGTDLIQTLAAIPASSTRNCTLHMWCTQTGANIVTWSFAGTLAGQIPSGFKAFQPTTTSQSYYMAIPIGPIAAPGDIQIRAASAAGIAVACRAWVSN